jgi:hypothetical protein
MMTFRGLVLLLLSLSLIGCGRAINRSVERRIREALPGLLGPARQYRVHVQGAPLRTAEGHLPYVVIDADDLPLSNGLLLDHLHLELQGVDYDAAHRFLRHVSSARFVATAGQNSLDEFLAGEAPPGENLRQVRVRLLTGNQVIIDAKRETLGLEVPFQIAGPLHIAGPTRIELDPTRLKVIGVSIPDIVLQFVKSHLESAVDLASLPFPVRLSAVTTAPGTIMLTGEADVEALAARSDTTDVP